MKLRELFPTIRKLRDKLTQFDVKQKRKWFYTGNSWHAREHFTLVRKAFRFFYRTMTIRSNNFDTHEWKLCGVGINIPQLIHYSDTYTNPFIILRWFSKRMNFIFWFFLRLFFIALFWKKNFVIYLEFIFCVVPFHSHISPRPPIHNRNVGTILQFLFFLLCRLFMQSPHIQIMLDMYACNSDLRPTSLPLLSTTCFGRKQ